MRPKRELMHYIDHVTEQVRDLELSIDLQKLIEGDESLRNKVEDALDEIDEDLEIMNEAHDNLFEGDQQYVAAKKRFVAAEARLLVAHVAEAKKSTKAGRWAVRRAEGNKAAARRRMKAAQERINAGHNGIAEAITAFDVTAAAYARQN